MTQAEPKSLSQAMDQARGMVATKRLGHGMWSLSVKNKEGAWDEVGEYAWVFLNAAKTASQTFQALLLLGLKEEDEADAHSRCFALMGTFRERVAVLASRYKLDTWERKKPEFNTLFRRKR